MRLVDCIDFSFYYIYLYKTAKYNGAIRSPGRKKVETKVSYKDQ